MTVAVLAALGDPSREAELAAAFSAGDLGVTLVRRCVDIADLQASAAAGLARTAIVSANLHQLDRTALRRLAESGVEVIALACAHGDRARLKALGITRLLAESATAAEVAAAAVAASEQARLGPSAGSHSGPLVAVWGPPGAPGRSTVALNLAGELAGQGHDVLCVDVDTYAASLGQLAGLLDEGSGLAAACRQVNAGELRREVLRHFAAQVRPGLDLLTGITSPRRWPELRPAALEAVLDVARSSYSVTVADVGSCVEQDEDLSYDTVAPCRNGAAVATLMAADVVVAVASADPIGIARLARTIGDLPCEVRPITVVNRVRRGVVGGGDPSRQIAQALRRHAEIAPAVMVPDDVATADAAGTSGRMWAEVSPRSPARLVIRDLAQRVAGTPAPFHRRRRGLVQVRAQLLARH